MIYLSREEVVELHDALIDKFGGLSGIRDNNLLESAIAAPFMAIFGEELHPTVYDKAASYLYYLSRNHPFLDGNKRTATASCFLFLRMNGKNPKYKTIEFLEFVVQVAHGKKEISFVSDYLKTICKPL